MQILDLIFDLFLFWDHWRFWTGLAIGIAIAVLLHYFIGEAAWVYWISIPVTIAGLIGGVLWHLDSESPKSGL